jgi:hypothetical protein
MARATQERPSAFFPLIRSRQQGLVLSSIAYPKPHRPSPSRSVTDSWNTSITCILAKLEPKPRRFVAEGGYENVGNDHQPYYSTPGRAAGGNAVGGLLKNIDLSPLAKTISGAVGGGLGGTILQSLIPALSGAASGGGFDIGAALGNAVGGGVTGAIVTVVVNLIKNAVFKKA